MADRQFDNTPPAHAPHAMEVMLVGGHALTIYAEVPRLDVMAEMARDGFAHVWMEIPDPREPQKSIYPPASIVAQNIVAVLEKTPDVPRQTHRPARVIMPGNGRVF